jgi:hypothetical protein
VCNGGGNGSATRGSVNFTVNCTYCPRTITITIIVTSGPELSGDNARDVYVMESYNLINSTCLNPGATLDVTNAIGRYDSPNNVPVTLGPIDVSSCATHFADLDGDRWRRPRHLHYRASETYLPVITAVYASL